LGTEPLLTVAIPTFDRNEILKANLAKLIPQMTTECAILILDNHSPTPVTDTLTDLIARHPNVRVDIVRHPVNIGGNANIVRCFESCITKWMWLLGDDDDVAPNAITTVLRDIHSTPDCLCINYRSQLGPRKMELNTTGKDDFIRRVDYIHNFVFISANVYNSAVIREQSHIGYHYAYSCAPHLVMLLASLTRDSRCFCLASTIAEWLPPKDPNHRYSALPVLLGYSVVPELPLPAELRPILARKLLPPGTLRKMATAFLYESATCSDRPHLRCLFRQSASRYMGVAASLIDRLALPFYYLGVRWPQVGLLVDRFLRKVLRRRAHPVRGKRFEDSVRV